MNNLTPQQIRTRLSEIAAAQAAHDARDFDAELKTVMQDGGDVDALEEAQLEAERQSRRLRVEAQALEASLPDAERAEALVEVAELKSAMAGHVEKYRNAAHAIVELREQLRQHQAVLDTIAVERTTAYARVESLIKKFGLPPDSASPFTRLVSKRLDTPQPKRDNGFDRAPWSGGHMANTQDVD
ncbi:hypothetical protein LKR43_07695 [Pusillimonas sp. MFBS29]|uniref:hypothetical protein n=1 Tax=Pusillimonas sp. MFBS29 TaxID=2886690 RepID=UPI001D1152EB|nr:hypothetical protein [Pusillimonas sp. MFBS29]MCC2596220.1 hypothetical protein [Pusillimonas sp. MFBS29]